jgi:hypothetical protein
MTMVSFQENPLIRELRVHHNKFHEQGAIILAEVIGKLSIQHIRKWRLAHVNLVT